jgi:hypothetical protein
MSDAATKPARKRNPAAARKPVRPTKALSPHPESSVSDRVPTPVLPLFYTSPEPLAGSRHGGWRLLAGEAGFAADTAAIPLVATDFASAARSYPILFTSGEVAPVALVGLERANLFVEGGRWEEGAYVPAYVRRYPFLLIEAPDQSGFGLAIDAASPQVIRDGEQGEALFTDTSEPAPVTLRALEFCRLFNHEHERARAFCAALTEAQLLVDRRADVTLPTGRTLRVSGFQVVDPERFARLDEATLVAWHRNGWLALVHFHLASLERFTDLLARQGRREAAATPTTPATSTTPTLQ